MERDAELKDPLLRKESPDLPPPTSESSQSKEEDEIIEEQETPDLSPTSESSQSREQDEIIEEKESTAATAASTTVPSQSTTEDGRTPEDDQSSSPEIHQTAAAVVATVSKPILTVALILLFVYLTLGVVTYTSIPNEFSGIKTNVIVDALYFSIVTLSTVGYGDIAPSTTKSKVLTMVLISIGFFSLEYLLNRVVTHLLDLQEKAITGCLNTPLVVEEEEGSRIKTKWKVCFAILAVVLCIIMGTLFLYCHEKMSFVDSVYLSVISVSTVGYGDKAFDTVDGRVFAVFWILASSVSVTSFFYYFAETTIGGSVMQANVMMSESVQEDQTGAAEFIVANLRASKTISEADMRELLEQYVNMMMSESWENQTGAAEFIWAKIRESKKISEGDERKLQEQYERWRRHMA